MTGLNRETDVIMSLCCFVTDAQLKVLDDKGFEAVIQLPKEKLDQMDDWCTRTHAESGLTAACIASTTTAEQAAADLLQYVKKYAPHRRTAILAGNSVHCDREFLSKGPYAQVLQHLHHRIMDVSTIKEAVKRWSDDETLGNVPQKQCLHQAREDILESIEEARYYRDVLFRRKERIEGSS
jgi:oligoribonuclease